MDDVQRALQRLRDWFLVWFVAEAAVGTAAAVYVLDGLGRHSALRDALGDVSAGTTVLAGAGASVLLLLLAATLFNALLRLEGWARIVVLVIGWITVCSAALNFLTLPGAMELYGPVLELAGPGWPALAAVSVLTKAADLAFWGWAIYVLQVNPAVFWIIFL